MFTDRRQFLAQAAALLGGTSTLPTPAGSDDLASPTGRPGPLDLQPDPALDRRAAHALAGVRRAGCRVPGLVAAVVRLDRSFGSAADGVRKLGAPDRVTTADLFHLGSCTKAMTATMLARLVDSGQIRWDLTLAEAFPAEADRLHAAYRGVTLDQLLRHRAGLPANVDWWRVERGPGTIAERRRSLASTVLREPPATPPGSKFLYSNVGYTLAAAMSEAVTGSPWEDLMRRLVFEPLGMASYGFGPPGSADRVDQPWGHRPLGPLFTPTRIDNPPVMGPAGTVHLAVADWARFALFHLGDGTIGGQRLLKPESLRHLHDAPAGQDYACGWIVARPSQPGGALTWQHGGSNTAWFVYLILNPGGKLATLVACNGDSDSVETDCLLAAIDLLAA